MIKRTLATLATAAFVLSSAAAFAASAPAAGTPQAAAQMQTQAQAKPATTAPAKLAAAQTSRKGCEKEWTTGQKAGKLNGLGQKDFLTKCMKGA